MLQLAPQLAVVTNVDIDHLDHYGSFDALVDAFDQFCAAAGNEVVTGCDDATSAALGTRHGAALVGTSAQATHRITELETGPFGTRFALEEPGAAPVRFELAVPGAHNARNAAVAAVAARRVGASYEAARRALSRFAGVARRFEYRGEHGGIRFVDDYAHLPAEVAAALSTAAAVGAERVVAVFQPHRYSRTAQLAERFGDAFSSADAVVVTDVYPAGEQPLPGVTGRLVADAVARVDPQRRVDYVASRRDLLAHLRLLLRPGDLCVTLGAGDLTSLPDEFGGTGR
jgi:UDP-N-acetylmuramate--alanine ligase